MVKLIIDKYFPKKLKLRVVHHVWDYYKIQYSYYMFIPFYWDIEYFDSDVADGDSFSNGWMPMWDSHYGCVHREKALNTIENIRTQQKKARQDYTKYKKSIKTPKITNL